MAMCRKSASGHKYISVAASVFVTVFVTVAGAGAGAGSVAADLGGDTLHGHVLFWWGVVSPTSRGAQ